MLEAGWQNFHKLKILCGGEALPKKLANQLQARSISLWNVYGPTETTIWSLISQVESEEGLISIGRPIANTEVSAICNQFQSAYLVLVSLSYWHSECRGDESPSNDRNLVSVLKAMSTMG
ncbi:AMP-binding protein [Nostoc sp. FACHB-888]|uniref:AMP-binding protein n=1 Tax=Nostoc sp. FACHB-888 TaxID=2692842 RepID=UPI00241125DC|nr:AMP-binding protein [Nostoc sp. FACHB-888]